MIRRSEDKRIEVREHPFGGEGQVTLLNLLDNAAEMYYKGRVFAHSTLQPGCSIGYHVHKGECETYYILNGIAEFNDNGILTTIRKGDVTYTPAEQGHGIRNIGDEPLDFIALILYKDNAA